MLTLLIYLLIFLGVCAIVWWTVTQMGLPQPVRVIAVVVMAIVGLLFLLQLLPGHHLAVQ